MRNVLSGLPKTMRMHTVDGADHSFGVLKSSGRTSADVLTELAGEAARFALGEIGVRP